MRGKTPLFRHKTETVRDLKLVCEQCCKQIRKSQGRASFTSWLFHEGSCRCGKASRHSSDGKSLSLSVVPDVAEQPKIDADALGLGDKYEVVRLIGEGGMGSVYEVRDQAAGQNFALKMLKKELVADEEAVKRFQREAKTTMALSHTNLCTVYGFGQSQTGVPYLVMELVEGESLASILEREIFLGVTSAVDVFLQICDALIHAHTNQVMHRDLKPSNVIITANSRDVFVDQVKVVDFGIAKTMSASASSETNQLTQTGELVGSPLYMSPEQCRGERLSQQSDIYSLGCVMYEVLTGNPPFMGPNPVLVILQHCNDRPARFNKSLDLPPVLEAIVSKCLEKDPAERYKTVEDLRSDLRAFISGTAPKVAINRKIKHAKGPESRLDISILSAVLAGSFGFLLGIMTMIYISSLGRYPMLSGQSIRSWQNPIASNQSEPGVSIWLSGEGDQNGKIIEGLLGFPLDPNLEKAFAGTCEVTKHGDTLVIDRGQNSPVPVIYGALGMQLGNHVTFNEMDNRLFACSGILLTHLPSAIAEAYHFTGPLEVRGISYSGTDISRNVEITALAPDDFRFRGAPPVTFTIRMDQTQIYDFVASLPNPAAFFTEAQKADLPAKVLEDFRKAHAYSESLVVNVDPNDQDTVTVQSQVDQDMIDALRKEPPPQKTPFDGGW